MKIYDCFLFNDELDLLQLRLQYLGDTVDYFVLVESERTLSGQPKILHFQHNKQQFEPFLHKIIHVVAPMNELPAWDYEFFMRNYIKQALQNCSEEDVIIISDADEIVNIKAILSYPGLQLPVVPELRMYYYFFNEQTNAVFRVNLVANWSFIRDKDLGHRYNNFPLYTSNSIPANTICTGWHFSYLFGVDMEKYRQKIMAFSHQEFNTPYYLNKERISRCVLLGIDIFERPEMRLWREDKDIQSLLPLIEGLGLTKYLLPSPSKGNLSVKDILFIFRKKHMRRFKHWAKHIFSKKEKDLH